MRKAPVQEDLSGPVVTIRTTRREPWVVWKRASLTEGCMDGVTSSLQGNPVRSDKTPEACRVTVRHRGADEGRPQERAEGAQAKQPISDEGELKRETNLRVWAT
jgi:hypothetical protein